MIIRDSVYGAVDVRDKPMLELIRSEAFQRLRDISQQGVPKEYIMPSQPAFYRYDHCVGVMLALRRLGAGQEEQVAGLLHDVSHTAFSHLVDYIFGGGDKEDYQDSVHHTFFGEGTELAGILARNGFDPSRISKLEGFSLLEREQPEMCADRLDYTLRYWAAKGEGARVRRCLGAARAVDGTIVFGSRAAAREFARMHMVWQAEWRGYGSLQFDMRIRWYIFGEALRIAMDKGIINRDDFNRTDSYVLGKIKAAGDGRICGLLDALDGPMRYKLATGRPKLVLRSKFRWVDPLFVENGEMRRLSEVDGRFKREIAEHMELSKAGIRLASISGVSIPIK